MYKDKVKQREAAKLAMRRYRAKGITQGITDTPSIVEALVNPKKRLMLEFISYDLNRKGLRRKVKYGIGGPDFEVISELLEVTA